MNVYLTLYMNRRDVTPWLQSLEPSQPAGCIYRQFTATFAGWHALEGYLAGATWDLYGSHDPANPRAVALIRDGIVPQDREQTASVGAGAVPSFTVTGYDAVWLAQRRRPRDTVVMVPDAGFGSGSVAKALASYQEGPVGRYVVWQYVRTYRAAVERLAREAGFRVDYRLPDHPLEPLVVPPTSSYWDALISLVEPWAPEVWYRRTWNTLMFLDPEAPRYDLDNVLTLGPDMGVAVDALPVVRNRVHRVILRVR